MLCCNVGLLPKTKPTRGIFGCVCAEAASDHPTAVPPRSVMNSRRLTRSPNQRGCQSIRCRTPALKQLLHREVPGAREGRFGSFFTVGYMSPFEVNLS